MSFNSVDFLMFLPVVVLIYYVLPLKVRYIWLLLASWFFYMCWIPKYIVLLLFATIVSYACGLILEAISIKYTDKGIGIKLKRWGVAGGICANLGNVSFF